MSHRRRMRNRMLLLRLDVLAWEKFQKAERENRIWNRMWNTSAPRQRKEGR